MSAHLRAGAVSRTEDASGAAGGCPQSVESAVLRAFEDASRTREGCFWHRISLPYRKRLFFTPNASENASRTPGSLFEHGTHIPYRRSLFLVPSPLTQRQVPPQRSLAYILVDLFVMWVIFSKFAQINKGLAMQDSTRREFHLYETLFDN